MLILVANLGSTSFKYRLFDMTDERSLARGSVDRIGADESLCTVQIGDWKDERTMPIPDHGVAVAACLQQLTDHEHGALKEASQIAAIGFKAVQDVSSVHDLNATVLHLLGLDHERLTFKHNGIERRLTDVHGHVLDALLA